MSFSEDQLSPIKKQITLLDEANGFGKACVLALELMDRMGVDPVVKSKIFGEMILRHVNYCRPTDKNLYDTLPTKNTI